MTGVQTCALPILNNVIIEYVEGIEVVKAFNQSTSSYEKFVGAVKSFKDFTLAWFKSTWKTMNLMIAIMPTTLLGSHRFAADAEREYHAC